MLVIILIIFVLLVLSSGKSSGNARLGTKSLEAMPGYTPKSILNKKSMITATGNLAKK